MSFDSTNGTTDNEAPMECTLALLADAANTEAGGKLNVLGVFDRINAPKYPYVHPQMFLVANLTAGPSEYGKKKAIEVSLIDPDGRILTTVSGSGPVPRPDAGAARSTMQIMLKLVNTPFPQPVPYKFAVLVGGDEKASIPLEAVLRPVRRKPRDGGKKNG